ncbi:MAG: hypothetical protein M1832_006406 [Thelocarpon impressellum]|nr:MAG: hypothetical protein M1832_006406 [Thelocarpon impressellum]
MKSFATSAALLALASCTGAAPAMQARDAAVPQGNTTFVLAAVIVKRPLDWSLDRPLDWPLERPLDVFASYAASLWASIDPPVPAEKQQPFVWDPSTNKVVIGKNEPMEGSILYVGPDSKWGYETRGSLLPVNSSTTFRIQPFEKGHGHDRDLELRAYDSSGVPMKGPYGCQRYEDWPLGIYSVPKGPETCFRGDAMRLMVTQLPTEKVV